MMLKCEYWQKVRFDIAKQNFDFQLENQSRGGPIRTGDHLLPKQVR